jgi:probable rRNA maturation factor
LIELECPAELRPAALAALAACGLEQGHVAVELVTPARIRELNREHRGVDAPTDVLAFPLDGTADTPGPREIGDVVICPEHTRDLREATVHGILHLAGHDHEVDDGEMLALQARIVAQLS